MSIEVTDALRPIDPFGFWPRRISRLVQRAGADEPGPDNYAFHTPYVLQAAGPFRFRGMLTGLEDHEGELILHVNELLPEGDVAAACVASARMALRDLAADGGRFEIGGEAGQGCRYALIGNVSGTVSAASGQLSMSVSAGSPADDYRRQLREARETIFMRAPLFEGVYQLVRSQPTLAIPVSQACTVAQFDEPAYRRWLDALKRGMHRHRKQWEFVYILQALDYYGALREGARGLGFGVGEEPLPALMASLGCAITATDLPPEDSRVSDWSGTGQHSASLDGVRRPELISDEALERLVTFRAVDMTRIPDDLRDYDFTWSSCALEHVGSIASGLDFIERSIECLRPGGIAVHTTELNLISDDRTLDHAGTVLFRRRDFEEIAARLSLKGHRVMPLNFTAGTDVLDDHIDVPPYSSDNHFKLLISRYLTTSFGLIVERGGR